MSSNKENQIDDNNDDVSNDGVSNDDVSNDGVSNDDVASPANSNHSSGSSSGIQEEEEEGATRERSAELQNFQDVDTKQQRLLAIANQRRNSTLDVRATLAVRDSHVTNLVVSDSELVSVDSDVSTLLEEDSFESDDDLGPRSPPDQYLSDESDATEVLTESSPDVVDTSCPNVSNPDTTRVEETGEVSNSNTVENSDGKAWYYTKEDIKEFFLSQNAQYDDEDLEALLQESTDAETLRFRLGITDVRTVCGTTYYEMKPDNYVNMPLSLLNKCLVCVLCRGYLIDPITMSVCAHNFCRFCVKQATHNPAYCPLCEYTGDGEGNLQKRIPNEGLANLVYTFFPGLKGYKHEEEVPQEHMQDQIYLRPGIKMTGLGYGTLKFKLDRDTTMAQVAIFLNRQIENSFQGCKLKLTHHGEEVNPFKTVEEIGQESGNKGPDLVFDYEI